MRNDNAIYEDLNKKLIKRTFALDKVINPINEISTNGFSGLISFLLENSMS